MDEFRPEALVFLAVIAVMALTTWLLCRRIVKDRRTTRFSKLAPRFLSILPAFGIALPLSIMLRVRWEQGVWPEPSHMAFPDGEMPHYVRSTLQQYPIHYLFTEFTIFFATTAPFVFIHVAGACAWVNALEKREPIVFATSYALLWSLAYLIPADTLALFYD